MKRFNLIDLFIIVLSLLFFYFVLTRIFGHSATDFTIAIGAFSAIGTLFYKLYSNLYKLNREVGEFKSNTKFSFKNLKSDVSTLKSDVSTLKSDVSEIKDDLRAIKRKLI